MHSTAPVLTGTINFIDDFGSLGTSFTPSQFKEADFQYGDLLKVDIEGLGEFDLPYLDNYAAVGTYGLCLCNYQGNGVYVKIAMTNGSFKDRVGGTIGSSIAITMKQICGYDIIYQQMHLVYTYSREDYSSHETFANFRPVNLAPLRPNLLYRGGNPFYNHVCKVRYKFTDYLCSYYDIKTVINLAKNEQELRKSQEQYYIHYCSKLLDEGSLLAVKMSADFFTEESQQCLAQVLRFILNHQGPYFICCNEGKDRTGFVIALIEALCGIPYYQIREDYLVTYENYYRVKKTTPTYDTIAKLCLDRQLYILCHPNLLDDLQHLDWNRMKLTEENLADAAFNYLHDRVKLTRTEIERLKDMLTR